MLSTRPQFPHLPPLGPILSQHEQVNVPFVKTPDRPQEAAPVTLNAIPGAAPDFDVSRALHRHLIVRTVSAKTSWTPDFGFPRRLTRQSVSKSTGDLLLQGKTETDSA